MLRQYPPVLITLAICALAGCAPARAPYLHAARPPDEWRTHAERTGYAETGRYAEAMAFCQRLAAASPHARCVTFGRTGQGRDLPVLVLSSEQAFTAASARRSARPLVLVQNCIHAGECEGKDACLALARDMLITGTRADLLNAVNVLILPIFNADGHERFGPFHRVNQNGPRDMGWRVTATNLNLNRDYTKADTVEMQAWLQLWNEWQPDLFIDCHTTDGHDDRYDVYYAATCGPDVAESVATWTRDQLLPDVLGGLESAGYATLPYCFWRDAQDVSKGVVAATLVSPRLSNGYAAACNRAAILVETHATKPYGRRVQATYELLVHVLRSLSRCPDALPAAVRQADEQATRTRGSGADGSVPLRFENTEESRRLVYQGVVQRMRPSAITGAEIIEYTGDPQDVETAFFDQSRVSAAVTPPAAYLVPPEWTDVIARLRLHGVRLSRLRVPRTMEVDSYRFEDVHFNEGPNEGRQIPRYRAIAIREERTFGAGTVVVPLDQPRAKLVVHLLEPAGPDSFVAWGLFNAIFEQKEYFEAYAFEPIAQRMLAENPDLRREFEEKLAADEAFAKDPGARLQFLYRRSSYWDAQHNVYPVARLGEEELIRLGR